MGLKANNCPEAVRLGAVSGISSCFGSVNMASWDIGASALAIALKCSPGLAKVDRAMVQKSSAQTYIWATDKRTNRHCLYLA